MRRQGFTLVELLIVLAIIAILSAIAIPNFFAAQTKARVARAVSDMRVVAGALETYALDHRDYPPNDGLYNTIPLPLTTPIRYVATTNLIDPFAEGATHATYGQLAQRFTYGRVTRWPGPPTRLPWPNPPVEMIDHSLFNAGASELYGSWRICSVGPDGIYSDHRVYFSDFPLYGADIVYDITNGVQSFGNLIRIQRETAKSGRSFSQQ